MPPSSLKYRSDHIRASLRQDSLAVGHTSYMFCGFLPELDLAQYLFSLGSPSYYYHRIVTAYIWIDYTIFLRAPANVSPAVFPNSRFCLASIPAFCILSHFESSLCRIPAITSMVLMVYIVIGLFVLFIARWWIAAYIRLSFWAFRAVCDNTFDCLWWFSGA